jgi:hypothetical protein
MAKGKNPVNGGNEGDLNSNYENRKRLLEEIKNLEEESSKSIASAFNMGKNYLKILQNKKSLEKSVLDYQTLINSGKSNGQKLSKDELNLLKNKVGEYQKTLALTNENLKALNKTKVVLNSLVSEAANFGNNLDIYDYLASADTALKHLNRDLGISGQLAITMTSNIEKSAYASSAFGASITDLTDIQRSFTEETGKILPLSSQILTKFSAISVGLGISTTESGKLLANFTDIGRSAESTVSFVEETLKTSQNIGVSGVKTIKILNENFTKLNKFNFKDGLESFRKISEYSLQTKFSLQSMSASADAFNNLESAINSSANLQVLGGELGKADAFQLGFLSRSNPEAYQKAIVKLTDSLYVYDKASKTFKASSVDIDRMKIAAQQLNIPYEEFSEMAKKNAQTKFISSKTIGLSDDDKTLVSQLATMNDKTKRFEVNVGGNMIDVQNLNKQQLESLKVERQAIEATAKASVGFDSAFTNTVNQLKATMLPVLTLINGALTSINSWGDGFGATVGKLAVLGVGMMALKGISSNLGNLATSMVSAPFKAMAGGMGGKGGGAIGGAVSEGAGKAASSLGDGLNKIPEGSKLSSKAKGIAAIGIAAVGIGAGIYLATKGVSAMADSFAKLNGDQLKYVAITVGTLTLGLTALGIAGTFAGPGVIAFGAGVALLGIGIAGASIGIGYMVGEFSKLNDPKIGASMTSIAGGMTSMAGSALLFANPLTLAGLVGVSTFVNSLKGTDFTGMNSAFSSANQFMSADDSNLKELRETLSLLKSSDKNMFSELKSIIDKGIEVKMSSKDVNITTNVTLQMDGDVIAKKLNIGSRAVMEVVNARRGT